MKSILSVAIILLTIVLSTPSIADTEKKPNLDDPEVKSELQLLEQAMLNSEVIVIGEYRGYEARGEITRSNPPIALYKPISYLSSKHFSVFPRIRYRFPDESESVSDWQFKKSMMPEEGSKWILFVSSATPVDGAVETYKGAIGRIPYSERTMTLLDMVFCRRFSSR